jgi:mRNA interferase RelE/StbE
VIYKVQITDVCLSLIERIPDKKNQSKIIDRIDTLRSDPEKKGKILVQKLAGFRSMHAAGRYRVVYRIDEDSNTVWVLAAGIRKEGDQKDIYKIAKKLLKLGLLNDKSQ